MHESSRFLRVLTALGTVLPLSLIASCESVSVAPANPRSVLEAEYAGEVSTDSWVRSPADLAVSHWVPAETATGDASIADQYAFYSVDVYVVDRAAGLPTIGFVPGVPAAVTFDRGAIAAALDGLEQNGLAVSILRAPVQMRADGGGTAARIETRAFVERFRVARTGREVVADPSIGVANSGLHVQLQAEGDTLQAELVSARTHAVSAAVDADSLYPRGAPLQLQVPLFVNERVTTSVRFGKDDVLVLGGIGAADEGKSVVALVHPRRALSPAQVCDLTGGRRMPDDRMDRRRTDAK